MKAMPVDALHLVRYRVRRSNAEGWIGGIVFLVALLVALRGLPLADGAVYDKLLAYVVVTVAIALNSFRWQVLDYSKVSCHENLRLRRLTFLTQQN